MNLHIVWQKSETGILYIQSCIIMKLLMQRNKQPGLCRTTVSRLRFQVG